MYIPLFPNPPSSPQHDGSDDIYHFPPCRIHESTPDPPANSPSESDFPPCLNRIHESTPDPITPANLPSESPPCRIHESTPDPITPPANLRKLSRLRRKRRSSPSEPVHRFQLPRALGAKNILNTIPFEQVKVRFPLASSVSGDTKEVFARTFRS